MSILIKNAFILTLNPGEEVFRGDIAIKEDRIIALGEAPPGEYGTIIDASGKLAMAGLVNAHGHSAMCLFRGYADDLELMAWLNKKVFPAEAKLIGEDVLRGSRLAILEMLKSGTTAFADMYFFVEETAKAVEESGIKANISQGLTDFEDGEEKLKSSLEFMEKWHNKAGGRIRVSLGPHAPYTCTPRYLENIGEAARRHKLDIQIHFAETQSENAQIQAKYSLRPLEYLKKTGLFEGNKVILAHGIWLNEDEIKELAALNSVIVHNPCSNMKLASGMAPICRMLKEGIPVAIGTDSACSNNKLDMFQELRAAAYLAKVRDLNPIALPAATALNLATLKGAKALGFEDSGSLKPGNKADIILIDLDKPHLNPLHDIPSQLVYAASGSDVESVIIDGRLIMHKREIITMDEEKIIFEANLAKERIFT